MSRTETTSTPLSTLRIRVGRCYVMFALDIGMSIDLDECERRITMDTQRETIKHRRRAPKYFEYRPLPLRVTQSFAPIQVGRYATDASVDAMIYDFGAVLITYSIPISGSMDDLLALSNDLYENEALNHDAHVRAEALLHMIRPAVLKPEVSDFVEDYVIYEITGFESEVDPARLTLDYGNQVAQVLRSERQALSQQEIVDAISYQISFTPDDVTVIDWNAAVIYDREAEDVRTVLEFANVELLEMRYLDQQLDDALEQGYRVLTAKRNYWQVLTGRGTDLGFVGQLQVDNALLFEGVNNALKLLGDQYLARVYQAASKRFHMAEWDESILRKIETLESIYQKMADRSSAIRMEVLEWIIIILILVSIVLPLLGIK